MSIAYSRPAGGTGMRTGAHTGARTGVGRRRWRGRLLALLLASGAVVPAAAALAQSPDHTITGGHQSSPVEGAVPGDQAMSQVAQGKYLVDLADCASCHSAADGAEFAGGYYMQMPFGDISTPNITPDKETGIGNYTDDQFVRVFREGINARGQHLYPAMPYPWYSSIKRADILAIKAYLFTVKPVHRPREPNKIYFPFTIRPLISVWDALFVPSGEFKPDPKQSAQVNRGDYLVNSLGHCGECHNYANMLGKTKISGPFEGGVIEKWASSNITGDKDHGIGRYTDDEVVHYLKTGYDAAVGTAIGPMRETVDWSTKKFSDADLHAVVAYLRTVPGAQAGPPRKDGTYLRPDPPGQEVYFSECVSCHQVDGKGVPGKVPALDGNGMVIANGPHDTIHAVLGGLSARGTFGPMPALGVGLTDRQIADVTNYIRQAWGNAASPNATPFLVSTIREDEKDLTNDRRPGGCPKLVQPQLAPLVSDPSSGIVATLQGLTLPTILPAVDKIVGIVRKADPKLDAGDIVNGLTIAYCSVVNQRKDLSPDQRTAMLNHFSERLYVQLGTGGAY